MSFDKQFLLLKQSINALANAFDSKNQNSRSSQKDQQAREENTNNNRDNDDKNKVYVAKEKNKSKLIEKNFYNIDNTDDIYQDEYYANENQIVEKLNY